MSGANAISGISIIGALIGANVAFNSQEPVISSILAFIALVLAMINVVGGFAGNQSNAQHDRWKKRGELDGRLGCIRLFTLSSTLHFWVKETRTSKPAPFGNQLGAAGWLPSLTILSMELQGVVEWPVIIAGLVIGGLIGLVMAIKVEMTGMPELVALFNGFGGAASALVALSEVWTYIENSATPPSDNLTIAVVMVAAGLSALVGWMTLTGSLLAMFKLKGGFYVPLTKKDDRGRRKWISTPTWGPAWLNPVMIFPTVLGLTYSFTIHRKQFFNIPVGNHRHFCFLLGKLCFHAPLVVVSLLNSLSGIAAAFGVSLLEIPKDYCSNQWCFWD